MASAVQTNRASCSGLEVVPPDGEQSEGRAGPQPGEAVQLVSHPGEHQAGRHQHPLEHPLARRVIGAGGHQRHGHHGTRGGERGLPPTGFRAAAGALDDDDRRHHPDEEQREPEGVAGREGPRQPEQDPAQAAGERQLRQPGPAPPARRRQEPRLEQQQVAEDDARVRIRGADERRRQEAADQTDERHDRALAQRQQHAQPRGEPQQSEAERGRNEVVEVGAGEPGGEEDGDASRGERRGDALRPAAQRLAGAEERGAEGDGEGETHRRADPPLIHRVLDEEGAGESEGDGADPDEGAGTEALLEADGRHRRGWRWRGNRLRRRLGGEAGRGGGRPGGAWSGDGRGDDGRSSGEGRERGRGNDRRRGGRRRGRGRRGAGRSDGRRCGRRLGEARWRGGRRGRRRLDHARHRRGGRSGRLGRMHRCRGRRLGLPRRRVRPELELLELRGERPDLGPESRQLGAQLVGRLPGDARIAHGDQGQGRGEDGEQQHYSALPIAHPPRAAADRGPGRSRRRASSV